MYSEAKQTQQSWRTHSPPSYYPNEDDLKSPYEKASSNEDDHLDSQLSILESYNTIFILDDSGSMLGPSGVGNRTLWQLVRRRYPLNFWRQADHVYFTQAVEALRPLALKAAKYDDDGVDIYLINQYCQGNNLKDAQSIERFFLGLNAKRQALTDIGRKLEDVTRAYLSDIRLGKPCKPLNVIIITDGAPTDKSDLEAYINSTAKLLEAGNYPPSQVKPPRFRIYQSLNKSIAQFGIQFIQIGNDREATAYLDKLDDDRDERKRKRLSFWSRKPKQRAARDIVDTTKSVPNSQFNSEYLAKALLGGIHRRIDKEGARRVEG
ncbi:uncharacterized protein LACBIDRAFT_311449 [Laccaria bicolor S238N-H82]|uniref:Predicted protein n=1 Tax=Laccaria bicolor (strain S238N-H82 / ATCC MYA-4686) TaxID=486041 RepID=B0CXE4_LACBS|nr:uncharacterized protein LACBIDRAFT_311449 [Laccaria bicolor S238N-H82]EDR12245.1 predicted protein [Laccaria bicolor S238N-H82]|eukprot:XP_001876509.1 predicted protein [Laccaria bicolor S238N-H82]